MNERRGRVSFVLHYEFGADVASILSTALGAQQVLITKGGTAKAFADRWKDAEAFIFVGALAIAVRSIVLLLEDKSVDPALVVVSEDGSLVLPVISGHIGGASDLARSCADILIERGAFFIPTVASDRSGFVAPDLWAQRRGYHVLLRSGLVSVIRKLIDTGEIKVWLDPMLLEYGIKFPLPAGYMITENQDDADLIISPRSIQKLLGAKPQIVPKVLTVGVGCRRGTSEITIERVLRDALRVNPKGPMLYEAVLELRSACVKSNEGGLLSLAERLGWELVILSDDEIRSQEGDFSPSAAERYLDLPGVAEPAAASAGELLAPRLAEDGVTIALAVSKSKEMGELVVVGTGPGEARFITRGAREALAQSDVIVGYNLYVDLLPPAWLRGKIVERYGMGEEEERVNRAMEHAESGYKVALVSGGDPSLFGLGALALSLAGPDLPVRIVPGITAAQAAGVAVGAPYANGLVLVSLSDYLQPWCDVVKAMEGARSSGLTVAIYNPVKRGLASKLKEVRRIFAKRRLVLVRDAGRPDETTREIPLEELYEDVVDMRTLLLFMSPKVREFEGRGGKKIWLEARGYESEISEPDSCKLAQFLILGGTTEGRVAAVDLMESGYSVSVSVAREAGVATVPEGSDCLQGIRNAGDWIDLFKDSYKSEDLIGVIDTSHPFAINATREMRDACRETGIPLCRYVRPELIPEGAVITKDPEEAASKAIELTEPGDTIFLATGLKVLPKMLQQLRDAKRKVVVRMLPTEQSMREASALGLEAREIIAIWGSGEADFNRALCVERKVKCIVSKASGSVGGVSAKGLAAQQLGLPLVLISRPDEPEGIVQISDTTDLLIWCKKQMETSRFQS